MATKFLHRDDAPFAGKVWNKIDEIVINTAKSHMSGRRILSIDGPFGLELKALPGPDRVLEGDIGNVNLMASSTLPVAKIQSLFSLSARDIAAYESDNLPFDFGSIAEAAISCAKQEDTLLFYGSNSMGTNGLLNTPGTGKYRLRDWNNVGTAIEDVIKAATILDNAGFHGPYILALASDLYNLLYRRYDHGAMTELEHLAQLADGGIVKASAIKQGGVLLAEGKHFASIALGQDLMTGFIGPSENGYEFELCESLALLLKEPKALCVLQ